MGILLPNVANWGGGPSREGTLLGLGDIFSSGPPERVKKEFTSLRFSQARLSAGQDKSQLRSGDQAQLNAARSNSELISRGCVSLLENVPLSRNQLLLRTLR